MSEPTRPLVPQPCTLVIFGGSGDLARRKLIPAVYNLVLDGVLPPNYAILGNARKPLSDADFREIAREGIVKYSRQKISEKVWPDFERRLFYVAGSIEDPKAYKDLRTRLEQFEADLKLPGNRIFYLAIPPTSIAEVVEGLRDAGLVQPPSSEGPFSRIIVEKPIGHDLDSARKINEAVSRVFDESQIFRIDHYLGKETVQNLLVLRFANSIFEPIWNHKFIDHVQITVAEAEGVGTRATYYEEAGALRDMVQNHILQLLCLVAMEPPHSLDADVVRNARMEVLRCLRPIMGKDIEKYTVRAQYGPGKVNGEDVPGYRREPGVELHFQYGEAFAVPSPEAYERLLLDVMAGDASLFMRRDAVEASWAWITGIFEGWNTYGTKWLPEYPVGSWGPVEANRLIESEGRRWRTL